MANKENNQSVEFVGIAVGSKVYFVTKAKAMAFIDGIDATKKEEKILNDLSYDSIKSAIEKTGVKNPKKLDCGKLARKLLGKKYEKLSEDVQSLARGVISAVANGALSVSAAKDAYDDVQDTIKKAGEMFDELKEKNEELIKQVGSEKVEETEDSKTDAEPEKEAPAEEKTAEEKAVDKTIDELVASLTVDNCDEVIPQIIELVDGDMKAVGEFCKKNNLFRFISTKEMPKEVNGTKELRSRTESIKNDTLHDVYASFFEGIDGLEKHDLGSKAYGNSVEKVFDACVFIVEHTEFMSEDELIGYGIVNPILPKLINGELKHVDMFGNIVDAA